MELSKTGKIQIIGIYESREDISAQRRVTDWFGDYGIYVPKRFYMTDAQIEEAFMKAIIELEQRWTITDDKAMYQKLFKLEEQELVHRLDDMYSCFWQERNGKGSKEWREELSNWEKKVVSRWDFACEAGIAHLTMKNLIESDLEL